MGENKGLDFEVLLETKTKELRSKDGKPQPIECAVHIRNNTAKLAQFLCLTIDYSQSLELSAKKALKDTCEFRSKAVNKQATQDSPPAFRRLTLVNDTCKLRPHEMFWTIAELEINILNPENRNVIWVVMRVGEEPELFYEWICRVSKNELTLDPVEKDQQELKKWYRGWLGTNIDDIKSGLPKTHQ